MSLYGHMKRPDGGYKREAIDVLSKEEIETIIDNKLKNVKIDVPVTTVPDDMVNITKMLVSKERSKLYSIYYFITSDITNLAVKHVEKNKTMVKKVKMVKTSLLLINKLQLRLLIGIIVHDIP